MNKEKITVQYRPGTVDAKGNPLDAYSYYLPQIEKVYEQNRAYCIGDYYEQNGDRGRILSIVHDHYWGIQAKVRFVVNDRAVETWVDLSKN